MEKRKPGRKSAVFADKGWRLVRLWETMMLLAEHPEPMSAAAINDEIHRNYPFNLPGYKCSVQTTTEDLKTLQKCGFPVCRFNARGEEVRPDADSLRGKFKNTRWGFREPAKHGEFLSPWLGHPSAADIISLSLCRALLKDEIAGHYPFRNVISRLLEELQIRLNKELARGDSVDVDLQGKICRLGRRYVGKSVSKEAWKTVTSAIARRRVLIAGYENRAGEKGVADIAPLALWFSEGRLYLLAAGARDGKIRAWRMDRFSDFREDAGRKAPEVCDADFEQAIRKSFKGFIAAPVEVRLRVKPVTAYLFREFQYHPTQRIIEHKDGSLTVTMECGLGWGFEEWLLGFGEFVTVEKPEHLRMRLGERITKMAEEYCNNGKSS